MKRKLSYINKGRSGYVVYEDEGGPIKFFLEYGGGDCIVIIYVPTVDEWTLKTNRKKEERERILKFVAEQSLIDHASGASYKILDRFIEIYKPE